MSDTLVVSQKGIAPVFLILIGALIVIGGIVYYKNIPLKPNLPVKTSDSGRPTPFPSPWDKVETLNNGQIRYTNLKDSYQLDLPAGWIVRQIDQSNGPFFNSKPLDVHGSSTEDSLNISVSVSKLNEQEVEVYQGWLQKGERLKVDGFDASRSFIQPKAQSDVYYSEKYLIKKERKLYYEIEFGSKEKSILDNNKPIIEKILDSFKFLNKSDQPVSLIEYKNDDLGYSFDYPSNWLVNTFQNNGDYNRGITVINEDDKEMLTLSIEPRYGAPCPPASYYGKDYQYPKIDVQLGSKTVHLVSDCNNPRVKTSNGYEFRMEADVFGAKADPRLLELLKSSQGLTLVK